MDYKVTDSKLMPILSKNLETIRCNVLNMKKNEFATKIGISASYLTEIIKCRFCVSLPLLEQIAEKTGYSATQLLSESTDCFKLASTFQRSHH